MIRETATVVAVNGDTVTVEAAIKSTCNACQAQSDCGTGVISRALAPKTQQLTLRTPMPVRVGQEVTEYTGSRYFKCIGLVVFATAHSVYRGIFGVYIITSSNGFTHELWAMLPSGLVTFLTYKLIAYKLRCVERTKYQPVLLGQQDHSAVEH